MSLQPSGSLIIESSTLALTAGSQQLVDIGGLSVQAQDSFAVVDGVTMIPGGPGTTISGKFASLESGGKTLDVGSGRFAIPPALANRTAGLESFVGGQRSGVEGSLLLMFGGWIICVMIN